MTDRAEQDHDPCKAHEDQTAQEGLERPGMRRRDRAERRQDGVEPAAIRRDQRLVDRLGIELGIRNPLTSRIVTAVIGAVLVILAARLVA